MADQRKLRQNVGLENMNMTSNCDVTNNAHQMQMTPYALNEALHENFLRTPLLVIVSNYSSRRCVDTNILRKL